MIPHSRPCVGEAEANAMASVVTSGHLAQGREVAAFEEECAAFIGRKYGVAVNSGTAALHLALRSLGIGQGDDVALPSYACAALAQAVAWQRALPVLCDIGDDFNLKPTRVPSSARAVIAPHLFGANAVLPKHDCIVEDLAQSFGGNNGRGSVVAITSFYATKMLTTGEGGMLFTDNEGLANEARDLRDYDNRDDFKIRYAYKMTDFQAAMGRVQLMKLPGFLARRREIADRYTDAFEKLPLKLPRKDDHVYFRYVVSSPEADNLAVWLRDAGVGASRPVYRPAHHSLGGVFPDSEEAHRFNISIPIYPALSPAEVENVVESVVQYFEQ